MIEITLLFSISNLFHLSFLGDICKIFVSFFSLLVHVDSWQEAGQSWQAKDPSLI